VCVSYQFTACSRARESELERLLLRRSACKAELVEEKVLFVRELEFAHVLFVRAGVG
jgi:hypothetical protein